MAVSTTASSVFKTDSRDQPNANPITAMSALRTIFSRSARTVSVSSSRAAVGRASYATSPHNADSTSSANEHGKQEAQKSDKQLNEKHNTDSEAAVKGDKHDKSIDQLQKETADKVCYALHL